MWIAFVKIDQGYIQQYKCRLETALHLSITDVSYNGTRDWESFLDCITGSNSLKELSIDNQRSLCPNDRIYLIDAIRSLGGLEKLELVNTHFKNNRSLMKLMDTVIHIKTLQLSSIGLRKQAANKLFKSLTADVEFLDISNNSRLFSIRNAKSMSDAIELSSLRSLNLTNTGLSNEAFMLFRDAFKKSGIVELHLSNNDNIDDECIIGWDTAKLKHISLSMNNLTNRSLEYLVHQDSVIEILEFNMCGRINMHLNLRIPFHSSIKEISLHQTNLVASRKQTIWNEIRELHTTRVMSMIFLCSLRQDVQCDSHLQKFVKSDLLRVLNTYL